MDAIKLLGSLLGKNALGSKTGGGILESLLGSDAPRGKAPSSAGLPTDILSTLLGGSKGSGKGGFAALAAILVAAAARGKGGGAGATGGDWLGSLLGGAAGKGGGLGELLGGLATSGGGDKTSEGSGGLGDLLGGLLGGSGGASPGMGGLLGAVLGGADQGSTETPPPLDPAGAEDDARLLIEAMCLAAKSDGRVDEEEREAIVGRLGDLEPDEAEFLRRNLSGKADLESFARRVPEDLATQVYAFSLMAVRLDSRAEAEYFAKLARELGLNGNEADEIHAKLGQPEIFA